MKELLLGVVGLAAIIVLIGALGWWFDHYMDKDGE